MYAYPFLCGYIQMYKDFGNTVTERLKAFTPPYIHTTSNAD